MNVHDWDEIKAGWPDRESPEYRTGFERARREFELGMQIRELRLAADLSQKELARMVGTSQPAIARLEAGGGMPKIGTLERVAQALGAELTVGLRRVPEPGHSKSVARSVAPRVSKAALVVPPAAMARAPAKAAGKATNARESGPVRPALKPTGVKSAPAKAVARGRVAAKAPALPAPKKASTAPKASLKTTTSAASPATGLARKSSKSLPRG
jgi:transcriptional regulator with XRE-family HTH domain